ECGEYLNVLLNDFWVTFLFELRDVGTGEQWHRVVYTALSIPDAICEIGFSEPHEQTTYQVEARSCVVLISQFL
ncbi:MAG: glycogen debranching enzyme, partial [Cyanobacteria bacterium P01_F01_bin.3]